MAPNAREDQIKNSRRGKFVTLKMHSEKGCASAHTKEETARPFRSELPSLDYRVPEFGFEAETEMGRLQS